VLEACRAAGLKHFWAALTAVYADKCCTSWIHGCWQARLQETQCSSSSSSCL